MGEKHHMSTDNSIASRLAFIRMDEETRAALRELQPLIAKELPGVLDVFYAQVSLFPETARHFSSQAHMGQAKQAQLRHWAVIASATFDDNYVRAVTKIGETHNRIGLEPRWYIGGYGFIIAGLLRAIETGMAEGWFGGKANSGKEGCPAERAGEGGAARHGLRHLGVSGARRSGPQSC